MKRGILMTIMILIVGASNAQVSITNASINCGITIKPTPVEYTDESYFTYTITVDNLAHITDYNPAGGLDVKIPPTLGGYPTTEIETSGMANKGLTSVSIYDNGRPSFKIGYAALSANASLTTVNSEINLVLEERAFLNCTSLATIEGMIDQDYIFDYTAYNCPLTRVTLDSGIQGYPSGDWGTKMGLYGSALYTAYTSGGAGTYVYSGGTWTKQ